MSQVIYVVRLGDTLPAIAASHNTTVDSLAALNDITNPDLIYVGQELIISGKTVSNDGVIQSRTSPGGNKVDIVRFGLQSNTKNTIFAIWVFNKSKTEGYEVEWSYYTQNGIWFNGNTSTIDIKESTYSPPDNALKVRVRVKPVSEKYTNSSNKEVSYYTGSWCAYREYNISDLPPDIPPTPTVEIDKFKLSIRIDNIPSTTTEMVYQIVQGDVNVYKTTNVPVKIGSAALDITVTEGHYYKVRAKGKRGNTYSINWSDWSEIKWTIPKPPPYGFTSIRSIDETSVMLNWSSVQAATSYGLQYSDNKAEIENPDGGTIVDNIENPYYIITGLTSGIKYIFKVRSSNSAGNSKWVGRKEVQLGEVPEPPTTWSDRTIVQSGEEVQFSWTHNSVDGSEQEAAKIAIMIGTNMDVIEIGKDQNGDPINTYKYKTNSQVESQKVYWKVKTQGVMPDYSDWSVQRLVEVHSPPTLDLRVTDMNNNDVNVVTGYPFKITAFAGPSTQKAIAYHVSIKAKQSYTTLTPFGEKYVRAGDEVYSRVMTPRKGLLMRMDASSVDLENNIEYEVVCTANMNTGLSVEERLDFGIAWIEPDMSPNAEILVDKERLSVSIRPYCERYENVYYIVNDIDGRFIQTDKELLTNQNGTSLMDAVTDTKRQVYMNPDGILFCISDTPKTVQVDDALLSIYRRTYDGKFVLIEDEIKSINNTFITDPHPSLDYARYRIVATDIKTGAISYIDTSSYPIGETSIVIQWDETWDNFKSEGIDVENIQYSSGSLIKLPYNIKISEKNTPDVTTVKYAGREHPVSYYGTSLGVSSTWTTEFDKNDEDLLYAIRRLSMYMGNAYVREPSGVGYWANVGVTYDKAYNSLVIPVTFNLIRVEGGI